MILDNVQIALKSVVDVLYVHMLQTCGAIAFQRETSEMDFVLDLIRP